MLSRKYRVKRSDITDTITKGATILGDLLYVKMSRKEGEKSTFSIIISKKNERTSVGRHFIKRKISSYIENYLLKNTPKIKKTVVFMLKNTKEPINYKKIEQDVVFILNKAIL